MAYVKTAVKAAPKSKEQGSAALYLIGVYKLVEGFALVALGIGMFRLLHRDIAEEAMHWVHVLKADPDNHYIHSLLEKIFAINPKQLRAIGAGTFVYAGLRFAEGFGLVMRMRWAEYLTVISTAVFVPLEVFELVKRVTPLKVAVLLINLLILWRLIENLRRTAPGRKAV